LKALASLAEAMDFDIDYMGVHFLPGVYKMSEIGPRIGAGVEQIGPIGCLFVETSVAYFEDEDEDEDENGNTLRVTPRQQKTKLRPRARPGSRGRRRLPSSAERQCPRRIKSVKAVNINALHA
jgi:hypothetical protein